jgi:hypothetical protein
VYTDGKSDPPPRPTLHNRYESGFSGGFKLGGSECNGLISTVSLARLTRLKILWFHLEVGETNFNHPEYDFSVLIT